MNNLCNLEPSEFLLPWLNYQFSLTKKLQSLTGNTELELLKEKWTESGWWAGQVLKLEDQNIFQREIMMLSHGLPCWYARTFIPEITYKLHENLFKRLKQESLGKLIFDNANVRRSSLKIYNINSSCMEYHWLQTFHKVNEGSILWCRLSSFCLKQNYFFLLEIFLPEFFSYLKNCPVST